MDVYVLHENGITRVNYGNLVTSMCQKSGIPREVQHNNMTRAVNPDMPSALSAGALTFLGTARIDYQKHNIVGMEDKKDVSLAVEGFYRQVKNGVIINPQYEMEVKNYFKRLEIA